MLIISLLAAAAATGTPTYLRCSFEGQVDVLITADEANSAVTLSVPSTGYIEKLPAAFSADAVRFRNRIIAYNVNRVDLTVRRQFDGIDSSSAGTCKVEAAPKRAF